VQCVEIGVAITAKNDRFAIDHELRVPVLQRGLDDPGEAFASVMPPR
jgi:hypothetical protein